MGIDLADLPSDVAALQALVRRFAEAVNAQELKIAQLEARIARLKRIQFGRSSEKIARDIEQLELELDELHEDHAERAVKRPTPLQNLLDKPCRKPLPPHLAREEEVHEAACTCPSCGGAMRKLGEDVTEVLEYVPSSFKVIRHRRPKMSCRVCETIVQAAMPSLPIERGRPGPGLIAHVLVSKYADHLPLYRQSEIYARQGVELRRSTLADWVGRAAALVDPLVEALRKDVMASDVLHGDDTPVPVLAPGTGKTKTGRLWAYVRDERPHQGKRAPAAVFFYSPDRKGEHPACHLKPFKGVLHADGYAGFNAIFEAGAITEAACFAHVRRKTSMCTPPMARRSPKKRSIASPASMASRQKPAEGRRPNGGDCANNNRSRCSTTSKHGSPRPGRSCRPKPSSPRQSAMRSRAGRRSPATSTTAAWRSTTTPPSAPSARLPSAARTICSPAPTQAADAPPPSTR